MRSQDDLQEHFQRVSDGDFLGFMRSDLVGYMDYDAAKPHLKEEFTQKASAETEWDAKKSSLDRDSIIGEMRDYMEFAIDKATGHRGISAERSLHHYRVWLWLLADEETLSFLDSDSNYPYYGVPCLQKICEVYGFDYPKDDEGWQNMADGRRCSPGCPEC